MYGLINLSGPDLDYESNISIFSKNEKNIRKNWSYMYTNLCPHTE